MRAGHDYGWPEVSYGVQYDARQPDGRKNVPVGSGKTSEPGVDEPIYYWVPSIAPSGMAFYTGNLFPEWKGNLFVGAMAGKHLVRLVLNGERVVAEEQAARGARCDPRSAPGARRRALRARGRLAREGAAGEVTSPCRHCREGGRVSASPVAGCLSAIDRPSV